MHRNCFVDVHEIVIVDNKSKLIQRAYKYLFRRRINQIIYHSESVLAVIKGLGFNGFAFFVPHVKYQYSLLFNEGRLSEDVVGSIIQGHINLLFFGDLRESKGFDYYNENDK